LRILLIFLTTLLFANDLKVMLLKRYKEQNISGWVMSEKLDGIRAYWTGKELLFRSGKKINAPKWFLKNYPPFAIDGELWSKRGDFENISSIVRDKIPTQKWKQIKHYIFDVPDAKGDLFKRLNKLKPYTNNIIKLIPQIKIQNKTQMVKFLKDIENKGGEGVVVRDPNAPYVRKRSSTILKVKTFKDDECKIVGYTEGKGRYKEEVGAIICMLKDKTRFKIGSGLTKDFRKNPPPIGTIVTFKYKELTTKNRKPRFPIFMRVRVGKKF